MTSQAKKTGGSDRTKGKIPVFRDKSLRTAALRHSSCQDIPAESLPGFERLEFLGDAILNYLISEKVYLLHRSAEEGSLSRYRAALVSRKTLALVASSIGLDKLLQTGKSIQAQKGLEEKILADALEALIAAVYLDRGMKGAESFVNSLFEHYWEGLELSKLSEDPKSELQEICQKRWKKLPEYSWTEIKENLVRCEVGIDRYRVFAEARSKKKAAAEAAARLLKQIRL